MNLAATLAMALSAPTLTISSRAFTDGQPIPAKHSCQGADVSPDLAWSEGPSGTRTYALIADDPDAPGGTFTHWVLFNLLAPALGEGAREGTRGTNDFGKRGYGGPCPPPGKPHRYRFHVYAVDARLSGLQGTTTAAELRTALTGHVLAEGELTGLFAR